MIPFVEKEIYKSLLQNLGFFLMDGVTLQIFKKTINSVVRLIGDNCETNEKLSTIFEVPVLGCASHNFNLAVKHWIDECPEFTNGLKCVHYLMSWLRTLKKQPN